MKIKDPVSNGLVSSPRPDGSIECARRRWTRRRSQQDDDSRDARCSVTDVFSKDGTNDRDKITPRAASCDGFSRTDGTDRRTEVPCEPISHVKDEVPRGKLRTGEWKTETSEKPDGIDYETPRLRCTPSASPCPFARTPSQTYQIPSSSPVKRSYPRRAKDFRGETNGTNRKTIESRPPSGDEQRPKTQRLPSLTNQVGSRTRFDRGDRKMLVGTRLSSYSPILTPRCRHGAVIIRPPTDSEPPDWKMRVVVLGGETAEGEGGEESTPTMSGYFEVDIDDNMLLGHVPFEWQAASLSPSVELLTSHSMLSLSGHDADKFVVFGGSHSASIFSTLYVIDGSSRNSYASMTVGQQPGGRTEHSCVIADSVIYVFGGRSRHPYSIRGTGLSKLTESLCTTKTVDVSYNGAPNSSRRAKNGFDQHTHVLQPCKVFRDLWKLNLRDFEWVRIPLRLESSGTSLRSTDSGVRRWPDPDAIPIATDKGPRGRTGHTAAVWGSAMFVSGGFDGESVIDDSWQFNLASEKWRQIQVKGRSPGCRYGAASCVVGDRWMIHGGISEVGSVLNDFFVLDFSTFSGSRIRVDVHWDPPKLLPSLAFHSAVSVPVLTRSRQGGSQGVLLIGGYGKQGQHCNAVYFIAVRDEILDAAAEFNELNRLIHFLPPSILTAAAVGSEKIDKKPSFDVASHDECTNTISRSVVVTEANAGLSRLSTSECHRCKSLPDNVLTLRARVDYLAARLHEQKFENLQLRTLTRESAGLRERLAEMEKQLLEFRAVRGHPLLGPVVKCCLEGLHMKGGGSSQTGNESSAKAIGTSQHSASQRSAKLMAEEGLDPDDRQDISSRCIRCLTWMSPPTISRPCGHTQLCQECIQPGRLCPECGAPVSSGTARKSH